MPTYHVGPRDHIHALGVVAATYNSLELMLFQLFVFFLGAPYEIAQRVFSITRNNSRIELLKESLRLKELDPTIIGHVEHFIAGFDLCAEARNFLMHSATLNNNALLDIFKPGILSLTKPARNDPTRLAYAHLTLSEIRSVADNINAFRKFGIDLFIYLVARQNGGKIIYNDAPFEPPLPEKPPLPRKLNLSDRQDPEVGPLPP